MSEVSSEVKIKVLNIPVLEIDEEADRIVEEMIARKTKNVKSEPIHKTYTEDKVRRATLEYFKGDELATDAWIGKYALKTKNNELLEKTPDDMHRRLAKEFARVENNYPNPLSEEEIYETLKGFQEIVPQGSPMFGIGNDLVNCSLSNCQVVDSPVDSVVGITKTAQQLALLFRARMGCGLDISTLRPEGMAVNNPAKTSSGAWSFADFYSFVCRMIGSNGRRGALMVTMDVRHPDIEKFVTMKQDLTKTTGANVSVRISDDFMEAVKSDSEFTLRFPVDSENPKYKRTIQAKTLWDSIVDCATRTAEPGLLMWDNICKNLPAHEYEDFKTISTNPCSEIPLSKFDSCRLISINLKNFVTSPFKQKASFDIERFAKTVRVGMRLCDDLVDLELEKLQRFIDTADEAEEKDLFSKIYASCEKGRRTGLGTHALADVFSQLKLRYDSDEALELTEKIYSTMRDVAYRESVELAKERGAFPVFDWDKEKNNDFIKRLPSELQKDIATHGRRNISILTLAPTGTVSLVSQTSSGIEPVFRLSYKRRRKLNHAETDIQPDFVDVVGDKWVEYDIVHPCYKEYLETVKSLSDVPEFFATSDKIDWKRKVELQAIVQKYIDHAISVTNNLPKGTPSSVVSELYILGHSLGLKGITVYVDGSRDGVLITDDEKPNTGFPQNNAPKRPVELECRIHHTTIKGESWVVLVGLMDNKPYELFAGLSNLIEIPKKYEKGILVKNSRKSTNAIYDLRFGENGDEVVVKDINKVFDNPNHSSLTRMISLALRHGAGIQYAVEQLQKDKDSDLFAVSRCIARVLKSYIPENQKAAGKCPDCQGELIYSEGCVKCAQNCGFNKCG